MRHEDELMTFIDASLERDLADLNLEAMLQATAREFAFEGEVVAKVVRMVGPELFRSGYLAGAKTGMEVAKAISKGVR